MEWNLIAKPVLPSHQSVGSSVAVFSISSNRRLIVPPPHVEGGRGCLPNRRYRAAFPQQCNPIPRGRADAKYRTGGRHTPRVLVALGWIDAPGTVGESTDAHPSHGM